MSETLNDIRLTSVEGNLEYRQETMKAMENVLNNEVSDESIGTWLRAAAIHLGSVAEEYADQRTRNGSKYTEEGEKKGGAVMFSDGTVKNIAPGAFSRVDMINLDANKVPIETGIIVNRTLINLSDKLLIAPEKLDPTDIGQLKRFLQFHVDAYPNAPKAEDLNEYMHQLEIKRQALIGNSEPSSEKAHEIETLLAE